VSASRKPPRARPTSGLLAPAVEPIRVGDATPQSQSLAVTDSRSADGVDQPKFRRLLRKETRLWHSQAAALTELRHRLTKARANRDEVLTDNTLIRVAVDLLLARADDLRGDTEDELRASVLGTSAK
jgi:hypothetical protein